MKVEPTQRPSEHAVTLPVLLLRSLLLALLHLTFGLVALFEHLVKRPWQAFGPFAARGSPEELDKDKKTWQKTPRHIAITFTPCDAKRWSLGIDWRPRRRADEEERIRQLARDTAKLARWSFDLGVERITVYDPQGLARRHPRDFLAHCLDAGKLHLTGDLPKSTAVAPSFEIALSSAPEASSMRIVVLSAQDGKPHLALVAQSLADATRRQYITANDITVDMLQEKLQSSLIPEPDLLIVLGGSTLRLHGFPPWHIRLTEIYHEPSLSILGPARLSYRSFRRAIATYSACEMRKGK